MNSSKFDVIVVGELNVDLILDGLSGKMPQLGKEIMADSMSLTLGSSSAIFASNLSMLGTKVMFCGLIGDDSFGQLVMDSLEKSGVDTTGIMITDKYVTGITVACSYGNQRAMVTHGGAMEYLRLDDIPADRIRQGRHLHLSSVFLQKIVTQDLVGLFSRAKKEGLTTSFDPQWDPDEKWDLDLQALLPLVDLFLPNIEEIKHLTGTDSLDEAMRAVSGFSNIVVVKDGVNGAHLWSGGKKVHQPAFLNPGVVDTIGAGDSFNAGFIHRFVSGRPLHECLEFAALTGAISTCKPGGTAAFQDLSIAKQIARDVFQKKL